MSDIEFNNIVSISSENNNVFQEITISNETNEFDTKDRSGSFKSELAKISELRKQKMGY